MDLLFSIDKFYSVIITSFFFMYRMVCKIATVRFTPRSNTLCSFEK